MNRRTLRQVLECGNGACDMAAFGLKRALTDWIAPMERAGAKAVNSLRASPHSKKLTRLMGTKRARIGEGNYPQKLSRTPVGLRCRAALIGKAAQQRSPTENGFIVTIRKYFQRNKKGGRMRVLLMLLAVSIEMPTPRDLCASEPSIKEVALVREILSDADLPIVFEKARKLLVTGLNAGSGYGEVWIRDLNTFIELSLEVNDHEIVREALLMFFRFQGAGGDIVDGYIPKERANAGYQYRRSALAPDLLAHKNTVETDQESSLVQAVYKYVTATGDRPFLNENIGGISVIKRLGQALDYLLTERFDEERSLVWGATTVDWGEVQPEHVWGVELDADSHRAIDIYDNAMFAIALDDYIQLLGDGSHETARWSRIRNALKRAVRAHLWDGQREKFIPHLYLSGSPFPSDFDETEIFYHGGTAVAIEAGFLTRDETANALRRMIENVHAAGAGSIGLTVYPPYPAGTFKNRGMGPYNYQNGGDIGVGSGGE